jgi:hypothetical protein
MCRSLRNLRSDGGGRGGVGDDRRTRRRGLPRSMGGSSRARAGRARLTEDLLRSYGSCWRPWLRGRASSSARRGWLAIMRVLFALLLLRRTLALALLLSLPVRLLLRLPFLPVLRQLPFSRLPRLLLLLLLLTFGSCSRGSLLRPPSLLSRLPLLPCLAFALLSLTPFRPCPLFLLFPLPLLLCLPLLLLRHSLSSLLVLPLLLLLGRLPCRLALRPILFFLLPRLLLKSGLLFALGGFFSGLLSCFNCPLLLFRKLLLTVSDTNEWQDPRCTKDAMNLTRTASCLSSSGTATAS